MDRLIDSRQLIAFKTLAQTGSFTQTAKKLFLSQSAISHSIRGLEEQMDCKLFDRVGKKVHLTVAGERFLSHADMIVHYMEKAHQSVEEITSWGKGRIRVGASTTACQYILPSILREFRQCFPQCKIIIDPSDSPKAVENVCNNETDLAITLAPQGIHECTFHPLFTDELVVLASPMHPLAQIKNPSIADLADQQWILYGTQSYTFSYIQKFFRQNNLELRDFIELNNPEAMKELIKISLGVGIMSPWVAAKEIREKSLVPLPLFGNKLQREWGITYLRGKTLSLIEETFLGLCESRCLDFTKAA